MLNGRGVPRAAVVALALALHPAAPRAAVRTVTFRAQDGIAIAASYFEPSRRLAPAVILVHMLTRTRDDWHSVAARLSDSGFAVLTFDLRGHGASGGSAEDPAKMVLDLKAARAYLADRSDVQSSAIGLAGASVGASLAALVAADEPAVRSLALVSPGIDYRGLRIEAAMKKYGDRPALLVAGSNDPYALRSIRQLATLGGGLRDLRTPDAPGHGTALFVRAPDLIGALVDWFQRTLL